MPAKVFLKGIITLLLGVIVVLPSTHASAASTADVILQSANDRYHDICILGEHLYYNGEDGIMSCRLDGSDLKTVSVRTGNLFTDGKSLYCGTQSEIIRISEDGTEEQLLRVSPLVNEGAFAIMNTMSHFAARSEWVYYILTMAQDYELWAVAANGQQNHRICSVCPPDCVIEGVFPASSDDGVYVRYSDPSEGSWSLVKVQGPDLSPTKS